MSWQVPSMADHAGTRQVFVGHPYRAFSMKDYRRAFRGVGKEFGVTFQFADEKITGAHIMEKISDYIAEADFSIFDISGWNPNVTLELGLAWGLDRPFFLLMNPTISKGGDAPSDIKGIDRLDWESYTELEEQLTKLLVQEYGVARASSIDEQLIDVRRRVIELLKANPGLRTEEIANRLNVTTPVVKMIMRDLDEQDLVTKTGQRRGTRYTLVQLRRAQGSRTGGGRTAGTRKKATGKSGTRKKTSSRKKTSVRKKAATRTARKTTARKTASRTSTARKTTARKTARRSAASSSFKRRAVSRSRTSSRGRGRR
jgi:DNA-binding MarR family transcriptional regulator